MWHGENVLELTILATHLLWQLINSYTTRLNDPEHHQTPKAHVHVDLGDATQSDEESQK